MAIPKVIHYCWLSKDPYPKEVERCISSWKEILPEYTIRLWDIHEFDLSSSMFAQEAYSVKKYAFASDVIRLYALYYEGGIYLDSDIMVLRSFDDLLFNKAFTGMEPWGRLAA